MPYCADDSSNSRDGGAAERWMPGHGRSMGMEGHRGRGCIGVSYKI